MPGDLSSEAAARIKHRVQNPRHVTEPKSIIAIMHVYNYMYGYTSIASMNLATKILHKRACLVKHHVS